MGWSATLGPKFDSLKSTLVLAVTKSDHNKRAGPENVYFRRMSSGEPPRVAIDLYSHLH